MQNLQRVRKTALFEQAFTERCHALGLRAISLNLAVGNPASPEVADLFKDVMAITDFVGYHAYGGAAEQLMNGPNENEFVHRWRPIKAHYDALGWRHPAVVYTESGTYFGWKPQFGAQSVADDYMLATSKMMQDDWLLGHCIFTCGGYGVWDDWDIADAPIFTQEFTAWNQANPFDSRGGKAQEWYHDGSNLRGGITQSVPTTPGNYWLTGWLKYETGRGGDPANPAITFRVGYDPTGQISNGDAGTIVWSADQIASRHLNAYIWYEFGVSVMASGSQTSIWFALDQSSTSPTGRVYVDALDLRATDGTPVNSPPVAVAAANPISGESPLQVNFDASGSHDSDQDPLTYSWNWGDGTPDGSGETASHSYTSAGVYGVTLTVGDGRGGVDTDGLTINVTDPGGGPTCENFGFEDTAESGVYGDGNYGRHAPDHWSVGSEEHSHFFPTNAFALSGANSMLWRENDNGGTGPENTWYYQACSVQAGQAYEASVFFRNIHALEHALGVWVGLYQGSSPDVLGHYTRTLVSTATASSTSEWVEVISPQVTASGTILYVAFGCLDDNGTYSGADKVALDDVSINAVGAPPNPAIGLSTTALTPQTTKGSSPPADTLTVRNTGGGILSYSISDNRGWLNVDPTTGASTGEPDTITVTYSTSGLAAGTHNATITVSALGSTNSPQMISVVLTVADADLVAPDFDGDGDVDQEDFGHFQACLTGPNAGPPGSGCVDADLDEDTDVDLSDYGLFQRCFSAASIPADPDCMIR